MKFKIKKGRHAHSSFWNRLKMFFGKKRMAYYVTFHDDCWYPYKNKDSKDFNKLFGMRFIRNHVNEADLVWLPDFDKPGYIKLWWYGYEGRDRFNGKYRHPFLTVKTGDRFHAIIEIEGKAYLYNVKNYSYLYEHVKPQSWVSIQPYFGGDNKAPHDMTITLEEA